MVARLRRKHSGNGMDAATSVLGDEGLANATLAASILFFSMDNGNMGILEVIDKYPVTRANFVDILMAVVVGSLVPHYVLYFYSYNRPIPNWPGISALCKSREYKTRFGVCSQLPSFQRYESPFPS